LATGGLQPFELPEPHAASGLDFWRMGVCGERIRLAAIGCGRLTVVDQLPGQPPEVTGALALADVLRSAHEVVGAAIEPDAATWVILHGQKGRAVPRFWTRIAAGTLDVLETKRMAEPWFGATGIAGTGAVLVASPTFVPSETAVVVCDDSGRGAVKLSLADVGEPVAAFRSAVAWPSEERVFAAFDQIDPFNPGALHREPSLIVLHRGRVKFASADLRRRFAPAERVVVDQAWALDPVSGRLWYSLVPQEGEGPRTVKLLGVDARTLRPDRRTVEVAGAARLVAIAAVPEGAVALAELHGGGFGLCRARMVDGELALTTQKLPL
jgi:hypothetical protein